MAVARAEAGRFGDLGRLPAALGDILGDEIFEEEVAEEEDEAEALAFCEPARVSGFGGVVAAGGLRAPVAVCGWLTWGGVDGWRA